MEINIDNFFEELPNILAIIACADYLAIDLEMSGVQIQDDLPRAAVSLEQVYERIRAAASTFEALQLGITSIRWTAVYQLMSFSIPITPMFATPERECLQLAQIIDRKITFSHSTLLFLKRHRFDFAEALGNGVPYLSRPELETAIDWMANNKKTTGIIDPDSLDDREQGIWYNLYDEILEWLDSEHSNTPLRIVDPNGGTLRRSTIRFVHEIVQHEFPVCRCWRDKGNWVMNIELRDTNNSREIEEKNTVEAKKKSIVNQLGISFVIEALLGGALSGGRLTKLFEAGLYPSSSTVTPSLLQVLDQDLSQWPEDTRGQ